MKKLEKINANIEMKQIGRAIIGPVSVFLGMVLIGKYTYQKGVTDCQKAISAEFPDEYSSMTEKILKAFDE